MILDYLANIYHKSISTRARKYLNNRGITDHAINHFNIGFCTSNGYKECLKFGFTDREIKDSMMFREMESGTVFDVFSNKITFPISSHGNVLSFTSRSIGDDWKKTSMSSAHYHKSGNISISFNHDTLDKKTTKYVIIVESPIDCISLEINGLNSIAILGTNRITRKIIESLHSKKIYLLFDRDSNKSGQKGAIKIAQKLFDYKISSNIMSFPKKYGNCDTNEFFLKQGTREELLVEMENSYEFRGVKRKKFKNKEADNRSILEAVEQYVELEKIGGRYRGICPFHLDSNPSFIVYENTESFFCFGCGAAGGVKQFLDRINY